MAQARGRTSQLSGSSRSRRSRLQALAVAVAALLLCPGVVGADILLRVSTNLRKFDQDQEKKFYVALFTEPSEGDPAATSGNFLNYVLSDLFHKTIFHRLVRGFVLQTGGFSYVGGFESIPAFRFIPNQFRYPNVRGTLAMARIGYPDPEHPDVPYCTAFDSYANSGSSQWFINLADNRASLDEVPHTPLRDGTGQLVKDEDGNQLYSDCGRRGFTVFGKVLADGMDVVDAIAHLPLESAANATDEAPELAPIFASIPVLEALSPGPFGNGCAVAMEPDPATEEPRYSCDASCTDDECWESIEARRISLRQSFADRLVKINKVKVVPTAHGFDRIVFLHTTTRVKHAVTGDVSKAKIAHPFAQADWRFSLGDRTWTLLDTRDRSLSGEVFDQRNGKTILSFDDAGRDALKTVVEERLNQGVLEMFVAHAFFFQNTKGLPRRCDGLGAGEPCFELDQMLTTTMPHAVVSFPDARDMHFTLREDRKRNLVVLDGKIPFEASVNAQLSYFEQGQQSGGTTKTSLSLTTPGYYRFSVSGPIVHHSD